MSSLSSELITAIPVVIEEYGPGGLILIVAALYQELLTASSDILGSL